MAFIQRNLPQPTKPVPFSLNNFSGGLNNVTSDSLLNDNEASDILNMTFKVDGTMEKRKGLIKNSNFQYPGAIKYLDVYKSKNNGDRLIVCTDSKVYDGEIEIADIAHPICGTTYLNNYYFVDGANIRVYGTFPQATVGSNIVVSGTPIPGLTLMTVVNPPAGFTPLADPNTIGKWHYDYTNKKIWYEPCAQELNDTYKGVNLLPTCPTIIVLSGDRLYMNGDAVNVGNVFITDMQNAFYTPVGLPLQMPPNGEEITGMRAYMNSVVVGRKSDVNVIYGNTNRQNLDGVYLRKQINTHAGFMNNDCIKIVHDFLFYLGSDGIVYRMNTTQSDVEVTSTRVVSNKLDLFEYPIGLKLADMRNMTSLFNEDTFYLIHDTLILVYSYAFQSWTMFKTLPIHCATVLNDVALWACSDGYIYKQSEDYSDDGLPIISYWASKRYDFGLPSNYKQFKEIFIVAHVYDDFITDAKIKYEIDFVDVTQVAQITNQISKWGTAIFGDRFITRNISPSLPINIGRRGRNIKIIIMNGQVFRDTVETYDDLINYNHPIADDLFKVSSTSKYYRYNLGEYTELDYKLVYQPLKIYEINGEFRIKGKR